MGDIALRGNKLTKKFNLDLTSLETPKHVKDRKSKEIKYITAVNEHLKRQRGKK
jgi:hypothetical protein